MLSQLMRDQNIPVVVLNACQSAMVNDAAEDAFASVAASLQKAGVRSVMAYDVLKKMGASQGWSVPLFVTVGSPLAVTAIRNAIAPRTHPSCVGTWFNAMDPRDVAALYPLDEQHFAVTPPIENKTDVNNPTENRHGISGYLSDPAVAKRIHDALIA